MRPEGRDDLSSLYFKYPQFESFKSSHQLKTLDNMGISDVPVLIITQHILHKKCDRMEKDFKVSYYWYQNDPNIYSI